MSAVSPLGVYEHGHATPPGEEAFQPGQILPCIGCGGGVVKRSINWCKNRQPAGMTFAAKDSYP